MNYQREVGRKYLENKVSNMKVFPLMNIQFRSRHSVQYINAHTISITKYLVMRTKALKLKVFPSNTYLNLYIDLFPYVSHWHPVLLFPCRT